MYLPLNFSRFWSGDQNNVSEGRYHTPFIFGSQMMEACLVQFNLLSDFYCSILELLRLSYDVSFGFDEASCPHP